MGNINIDIVLGSQFGDEGKGLFVNHLTKKNKSIVIRFSGGHQVGHTCVVNGKRHVFSNFGSGTFNDVPTYWSEYCTVEPNGVKKEYLKLKELGFEPMNFYDGNAMVTTPYDIYANRKEDEINGHGSVGIGFGKTIERNENNYRLFVRDLMYPQIRDEKLKNIADYYGFNRKSKLIDEFKESCDFLVENQIILFNSTLLKNFNNFIFEGSQGIMLDKDYGFFPNVTRSNTTSKNAIEFVKKYLGEDNPINIYYMSRIYQNRHGNGYMTNEYNLKPNIFDEYFIENPNETNVYNKFQGEFRKTILDIDLLKYALSCDMHETQSLKNIKKNIVFTCADQLKDVNKIPYTINGELYEGTFERIKEMKLYNMGIYISSSDDSNKITKI